MDHKKYDFENDFSLDENQFIEQVMDMFDRNKKKFNKLSDERLKEIKDAAMHLKDSLGGGIRCSFEPLEQIGNAAYIKLVGREIVVRKPRLFLEAVKLANNYEVYPRTDGLVQMNITFYETNLNRKAVDKND